MNVFEAVKQSVTTRQAAEMYGIRVNRNGMCVCPFHKDRNPSMKVDRRFHCFACQADGDVVDFASRLFALPVRDAAVKIADDFGIGYDHSRRPASRPQARPPTREQIEKAEEEKCCRVLTDYLYLLRTWRTQYAPQSPDEEMNPLFVETLHKTDYVEYLLDILLYGSPEERKAIVADQRNEVKKLEQRITDARRTTVRGRSPAPER